MSKLNISQRNIQDFEYIYTEIIRFTKGYYGFVDKASLTQFLEAEPEFSIFCYIPSSLRPEGEIVIGSHAHDRFYDIARRIRVPNKIKIKREISVEQLVDALKSEFSLLILEQKKPIDKSTSDKIVSRAVNATLKDTKAVTHYIPIYFFADYQGEELEFGTIRIIGSESFVKECLDDDYLQKNHWCSIHNKQSDFTTYFEGYNAVLCIDVPPCEEEISKQRALLVAKVFIGIAQLFSGRDNSCGIGIYDHSVQKSSFVVNKDSQNYFVGIHDRFGGASCDDWRELLNPNDTDLSRIYSETIGEILNPKQNEILGNRLIDAILWYSDAVSDKSILSRIVKYAIAIERLTTTDNKDVSKSVQNRASKLIAIFEGDRDIWKERIDDMYSLRSDIVHGTLSISGGYETHSDYWAEIITQKTIMSSSIFFYKLGIGENLTPKALKSKFEEMELLPDKKI